MGTIGGAAVLTARRQSVVPGHQARDGAFIHLACQHMRQLQCQFRPDAGMHGIIPKIIRFLRIVAEIIKLAPRFGAVQRKTPFLGSQAAYPWRPFETMPSHLIVEFGQERITVHTATFNDRKKACPCIPR